MASRVVIFSKKWAGGPRTVAAFADESDAQRYMKAHEFGRDYDRSEVWDGAKFVGTIHDWDEAYARLVRNGGRRSSRRRSSGRR